MALIGWVLLAFFLACALAELAWWVAPKEPSRCGCRRCSWYVTGAPDVPHGKSLWISGQPVVIRPLEDYKVLIGHRDKWVPWDMSHFWSTALLDGLLIRGLVSEEEVSAREKREKAWVASTTDPGPGGELPLIRVEWENPS